MFIKSTLQRIHAFGTADGKDLQWLRPGWNEFPERIWKEYETHPDVKTMLASGELEVLQEKVTIREDGKKITKVVGKGDEPIRLRDLDESRAIQIVKETRNRDILQRWHDEETRSKVKRALDKAIQPLLPEQQAG